LGKTTSIGAHSTGLNGYSRAFAGRYIVMLFFLLGSFLKAYDQVITGTVLDKNTNDTISFATVFINGTFIGTYTDEHGHFALDISEHPSMPLTVSAIGYYSVTLAEYSTTRPIMVTMKPKVYELKEIVITAKSLTRQRRENLELFRKEFIGRTGNALHCEIMNENDITFNYGADQDTLKAFASKPILIDNKALGYKIIYYLDNFEYYHNTTSFFFKGSIIFKEDLLTTSSQKQSFERKRRFTYLGSRMHFFRALWDNELQENGFTVNAASGKNLGYGDIVYERFSTTKYLRYYENLVISYYTRPTESQVVFLKDKVYFTRDGYYDPSGISWEGEMAQQRIADWLPYEYSAK
jgi:hypothetical protein